MWNTSRRFRALLPILLAVAAGCSSSGEQPAPAADAALPVTDTTAPVTGAVAPVTGLPAALPGSVDLNDFAVVYADVFMVQLRAQKLISAAIQANDAVELAKLRAATERSVVDIVERHGMPIDVYKQTVRRLNEDRALSQKVADQVQKILKDRGDLPADAPRAVVGGPAKGPAKGR